MDQLITEVIAWLGEQHGFRDTYGWVYVLGAAMSVWGAFKAREFAQKRNVLRQQKANAVQQADLSASLYTEEDGTKVRYSGSLCQGAEAITIIVHREANGTAQTVASQSVSSMDEAAEYLRQHTKFILADFR